MNPKQLFATSGIAAWLLLVPTLAVAQPIISADPTSIDFGPQDVGTTSSTTQVTVDNLGDADLTVASVVTIGSNSSDFAVDASPPIVIAAGGSATFSVAFEPIAVGARSATVRIVSDDPAEPQLDIGVSGTGVGTPAIVLQAPADGSLDFGDVLVAGTSPIQTVTVRNDGTDDLIVSSAAIVSAGAAQFGLVSGPAAVTLPPGGRQSWDIVFEPTSPGNKSATFRIDSNDPDLDPVVVSLDGRGVQGDLVVSRNNIAFPETRVCETAAGQTVVVRNEGTAPVTVSAVTVSSSQLFPLSGVPSLPRALSPGQSFSFEVAFEPSRQANEAGTIIVESDTPAGNQVVALSGPGRVAGFAASPMTFNFGDVEVAQPARTTFTLENNGGAAFRVDGVSSSDTENFAVILGTPGSLPATLDPGETLSFDIRAQPQAVGAANSNILVSTDVPTCNGAPGQVTYTVVANGVAAGIDLSTGSVDFDVVDVQAAEAAVQEIVVENTGSASLEIEALSIEGEFADDFSVVDAPELPVSIAPGASLALQVAFLPQTERGGCGPGQDANAVLRLQTDALGAADVAIALFGCGIDRHISLSTTSLRFPPTYRGTDEPSLLTFDLANTGEAPLQIASVMSTGFGASSYSVVSDVGMSVAGGDAREVTVAFVPEVASDLPIEAQLVIVNDDDQEPMATIQLEGQGILPELAIAPGLIEFGPTAVGATATLGAGQVVIENQNSDRPFVVRELRFTDVDGAVVDVFDTVGFGGAVEIGASDSLAIDLAFSPDRVGVFEGRLEIYVGADELPFAALAVSGVGADARLAGSGCAAGGADAGHGWLAMLAVLLAGAARRRRASKAVRAWVLGVVVFALLGATGGRPAHAQESIDLTTFRPAFGGNVDLFTVESPLVAAHGTWTLGLFVDYASNPLRLVPAGADAMSSSPVSDRTASTLTFTFGLFDRFEIGTAVPVLAQSGDLSMLGVPSAEGAALGDVGLWGKAELWTTDAFSLGASTMVTLPTGAGDEFAGARTVTAHARGLGALDLGAVRLNGNLGLRMRGRAQFLNVEQGNEFTYGAGASYPLLSSLSVVGELFGGIGLGGAQGDATSTLEMYAGLRYRLPGGVSLAAGGGRGVLDGIGSPDRRFFFMFSYAPGGANAQPSLAETARRNRAEGPPLDDGDDDGDVVLNFEDRCPTEPEDKDGFEDDDGCPDKDNDGDGVEDALDQCQGEAEDRDGFEDNDGCIDADNDGDGIPDVRDSCPDQVEDLDGFRDGDGCDDPDNDRDGIPDVIDGCAVEPETINGRADDDGCPDDGKSAFLVRGKRIELVEPVAFRKDSARLTKDGRGVLAQIAALMRARPEWKRVRIAVHVHARGANDTQLSARRARAIVRTLTRAGVEPDRLETEAMGSTRPLRKGSSARARRVNDRLEIRILR